MGLNDWSGRGSGPPGSTAESGQTPGYRCSDDDRLRIELLAANDSSNNRRPFFFAVDDCANVPQWVEFQYLFTPGQFVFIPPVFMKNFCERANDREHACMLTVF